MTRFEKLLRGACLAQLLAAGATLLPPASGAQGIPVEPLTIRIADAIGAPGGATAIVFRTYASRPVRRGRVAFPGSALTGLEAAGAGPIASVQSAEFYTPDGAVTPSLIDFNAATQELEIEFDTDTFYFNSNDGVLGVIFVTLDAGVTPGSTFPLNLDPSPLLTFLTDPEDDNHLLDHRGGELDVRAAATPFEFEVDGGEAHPGSGATAELGTAEPFAIASGRIVVEYVPAHFDGPPTATADARHGSANLTVSYPAANRVQIDIESPGEDFNRVPGDLILLHFATRGTVPMGTISTLDVITASSFLEGPGEAPLAVQWFDQGIEFKSDTGIFADGFQSGDAWLWSSVSTSP